VSASISLLHSRVAENGDLRAGMLSVNDLSWDQAGSQDYHERLKRGVSRVTGYGLGITRFNQFGFLIQRAFDCAQIEYNLINPSIQAAPPDRRGLASSGL